MLATVDFTKHYAEQIVYESDWTENTSSGISWLNLLTAEPIPEETDGIDACHTPGRNNSESNCSSSSSSIESCYVVLEIQRPRSMTEIPNDVQKEVEEKEEEEEEEEIEEEIEELHFAQTNIDNHIVNYGQLAVSMTIEVPLKEQAVEHLQEQFIDVKEYAQATEPIIHETSNDILFSKAKTLSRFTKRMKAMSYLSKREQHLSTSSDDESSNTTKLKTIRQINEFRSSTISTVTAEQQPTVQHTNSSRHSTTSLDSIDNKLSPSVSLKIRTTTTFSNLSSQRTSNPTQTQRSGPKMGTTTLTRTFAFDRACMEKYGQAHEQKTKPMEISIMQVNETSINKDVGLPPKKNERSECSPPPLPKDTLHCRSLTNSIPNPSCIDSETNTIDESKFANYSSMPSTTFGSHSLSKTSSVLCLMKKCARTITSSEYRLTHEKNENIPAEPKLLQVTYLDGRLPLKDNLNRELPPKTQTLSGSISSRLNKLGLPKMSSTQDLSSSTASVNASYRKRMFNRFRNLIENDSNEPSQSRPWQQKTITELFSERKQKH